MGRRGGRRRRQDVDTEQGTGTTLDLRKTLAKEKRELARLNDRIGNLQDDAWIRDQIEKTVDRRDKQELHVLNVEDACKKLGLLEGDQLELPGTPPDPSEPRWDVRDAVVGHLAMLPGDAPPALLPGPMAALPAPRVACDHDAAGWDDVDDLWRKCRGCGVMDEQPCPEAPPEQPEEEPPGAAQQPPEPRRRGRPRKTA